MKFKYHTDPSHGWLAVPRLMLSQFGVAQDISTCSHFDPETNTVYLEEDDDAGKFLTAYRAAGHTAEVVEHYAGYSRIPRLPLYSKE